MGLDVPRTAKGRLHHTVGFIIIEESLAIGIPLQFLTTAHGDVGHVTHGRRVVTHIGGCFGLTPGQDAVHEVFVVTAATAQVEFIRSDDFLKEGILTGFEVAAMDVDENPAVFPFELESRRATGRHRRIQI